MSQWRPVPGWEGFYEVSDDGQVKSLERVVPHPRWGTMRMKERTLKPGIDGNGYPSVVLHGNGRRFSAKVHRLVLLAFVGPCPEGMEGCHWDDDKINNTVGNLRWAPRSENIRDQVRNGRHIMGGRTHCPRGHALVEPNLTTSGIQQGRRRCLSCARTRNYIRNHAQRNGETFTVLDAQKISDQYHWKITKENSHV